MINMTWWEEWMRERHSQSMCWTSPFFVALLWIWSIADSLKLVNFLNPARPSDSHLLLPTRFNLFTTFFTGQHTIIIVLRMFLTWSIIRSFCLFREIHLIGVGRSVSGLQSRNLALRRPRIVMEILPRFTVSLGVVSGNLFRWKGTMRIDDDVLRLNQHRLAAVWWKGDVTFCNGGLHDLWTWWVTWRALRDLEKGDFTSVAYERAGAKMENKGEIFNWSDVDVGDRWRISTC